MEHFDLLKALAAVRSALRDLFPVTPDHPLAPITTHEGSTGKKDVQRLLATGNVLAAAHSAYASAPFRTAVARSVAATTELLQATLAAQWAPVMAGTARVTTAFTLQRVRHLPKYIQQQGFLPADDTRELISILLNDPIMLALWAEQQRDTTATKEGLLKYAASNSTFMDRAELFGPRVNVSSEPGVYTYVFVQDLAHRATTQEDDMDLLARVQAPEPTDCIDLELTLYDAAVNHGYLHPGDDYDLFGELYDLIRHQPDLVHDVRRGHVRDVAPITKLRSVAACTGHHLSEVERIADALSTAIRVVLPPATLHLDPTDP